MALNPRERERKKKLKKKYIYHAVLWEKKERNEGRCMPVMIPTTNITTQNHNAY